ncbi:MAG: protein phosphatase 2C domain-containing protein [Candidatus Thermoplasmatota archaeon]|jgi:protein phosphatase|nr:protein phosphatase 2C domain-containing protein [Candidatus Thermoplasmatota archaeon]
MIFGHASITGKVREKNEDSVLALQYVEILEGKMEERFLGAVADGMGGGEYGEIASKIAIESLRSIAVEPLLKDGCNLNDITGRLRKSYESANSDILSYSMTHSIRLMGTTATSIFICGYNATIGNIGDSRTYIFDSKGSLKFVTRDHSYVQELIDAGQVSEMEGRTDPRRNQLTRSIGIEEECLPDFYTMKIEKGYSILLCSDGYWDSMSDHEIGNYIAKDIPVQKIVENLAHLANERDGTDNISLLLIKL